MILLNKLFGIVSGLFFSFICPPLLHPVSHFFLHFERKLVYYVVLPCCTPASSGYNRWSGLRIFSRDWNKNPIDMTVTWLFLFFLSFFLFCSAEIFFFLCKISTSCFHCETSNFSLFLCFSLAKKGLNSIWRACAFVWSPSIQWNCLSSFFLHT